jgi:TetR/AcrR family transcriptional regulator
MPRPQKRSSGSPGTRTRILAAAAAEFGARGFAATSVDRIARRARVNKAMIYYHFKDKRALYASILRGIYATIGERLHAVASQSLPPAARLDGLIDALVHAFDEERPFLPMFLRELAEGGAHLGREELGLIAAIFATISGVIAEGVRAKTFQPVHPALAHFSLIGPLFMFRATAPVRARIRDLTKTEIPDADSATVARHLQMLARRMLAPASIEEHHAHKTLHRQG